MQRKLVWDCVGGGNCGSQDQGTEPGVTNPNQGFALGPWGHEVSDVSVDGDCTGVVTSGGCQGFLAFFNQNGGVTAFGYPKTDARVDTNGAGTLHIAGATPGFIRQYFQAGVFEFHPKNKPQYRVQLTLLGDSMRNALYPNGAWSAFRSFRDAAPISSGSTYEVERVIPGPQRVQAFIEAPSHITEQCAAAAWQTPAQPFCGLPSVSQPSAPSLDMPFVAVSGASPLMTGDVVRTRNGSPDFDVHVVLELIGAGANIWGFAVADTGAQVQTVSSDDGGTALNIAGGDVGVVSNPDSDTHFQTADSDVIETGTVFLISVHGTPGSTTTTIKVVEGQVNVRSRGSTAVQAIPVKPNEQITVVAGPTPRKSRAIFTTSDTARIQYLQSLKPLLGSKAPVQVPPVVAPIQ
jgi:hypothetical protein